MTEISHKNYRTVIIIMKSQMNANADLKIPSANF